MTTIIEASEIINSEFAGCYASVTGKTIKVTYRGKKKEKIIIENGTISVIGGFQIAQISNQIKERFNLEKI